MAGEHLRPAEEVTPEIGIAPAEGALKIIVRFHLFSNEANIFFLQTSGRAVAVRVPKQIDLDECGQLGEGKPGWRFLKVIKGDQVSGVFEAAAGGDDFLIRLNGLEDFPVRRDREEE